jgi:hypothetical protein
MNSNLFYNDIKEFLREVTRLQRDPPDHQRGLENGDFSVMWKSRGGASGSRSDPLTSIYSLIN